MSRSASGTSTVQAGEGSEARPAVGIEYILPGVAASAVQASGLSAALFSSALNPSMATQASRVGALLRMSECSLDDDTPSSLEQPIQPPVGDSYVRYYVGACVCSSAISLLALAGREVCRRALVQQMGRAGDVRQAGARRSLLKLASNFLGVSVAYLLPGAVGSASTALAHASGLVDSGVALFSLFTMVSIFASLAIPCARRWQARYNAARKEYENADETALFIELYGEMVLNVRYPLSTFAKMYFFEDVGTGALISALAGIKQPRSCTALNVVVCCIAFLHLVFIAAVRPYADETDNLFSAAFALNQCVIAVAATTASTASSQASPAVLSVIAYAALVQSCSFVIQAVVQGAILFVRTERRKHRIAAAAVHSSSVDLSTDSCEMQMLTVPLGGSTPAGTNPLTQYAAAPP